MFAGGHCKARIAGVETTEGCPITPGTTLNKVQIKLDQTERLLNKPYVNVVTLTGQNLPLKFC